jgi:plasmid stabilization system protein ParE
MTDYRFTPEAEDLARVCLASANRVESAIHDTCFFSCSGAKDLLKSRRAAARAGTSLPVLVYRLETQPLEIVRILHGVRDLKRLLKS